jgi:predicted permease
VSDGFFRTLGVKPILGRDFVAGEDLPSAPRAVLLSYGAWQQRHGGRRNVLGQSVTLNDKPYTVVGVLPPEFHFAPVGAADYWITLHDSTAEDRGSHGLLAIARLKDGVNFKLAAANIAAIGRQLAAQYPRADEGRGGTILTLTEEIVGDMRPVLIALLAGATLLLVIACTNVASLLLVRAESRRREIAVRGALGASHIRLLRQLVTESVVLVGAGTSLGMTSAYFAMKLLMRLIPANMLEGMPYLRGLGVNGRVLAFAGLLSLLAGLLFSLAPAMRLYVSGNRLGMQADLAEGGRGAAGTLWRRLGPTLVLVELATAMVLLSGAGLLGKSFYRLLHTDIGFRPDHLAMLRILGPDAIYNTAAKNVALERMVVAKLQSVPGVRSVGICSQLPLGTGGGSSRFNIVGRPKYDPPVEVDDRRANSSYFSTLGTRLLRGRFFDDAEDSSKPAVMIVNQSLARKYFPGEDPAGKRVYFDDASKSVEIVGVVEDIKEGPLDVATKPIMYNAFNQDPDNWFFAVVRTGPSEEALLPTLTAAIHELDPSITTSGETTMRERFHDSSAASLHRASTWLVGGFAALALVLSVVGLYGVIAYSVSQRTREIGVRMALGAQRGSVYRLILKEAGSLTAIGIAVGLACSVVAATLMRSLLFGTQAWDAPTLAAVAIVLFVSASLASFLPARRAASVDPAVALRAE